MEINVSDTRTHIMVPFEDIENGGFFICKGNLYRKVHGMSAPLCERVSSGFIESIHSLMCAVDEGYKQLVEAVTVEANIKIVDNK